MPLPSLFKMTLEEIIINHRGSIDEPLDGDGVDDLLEVLREEINHHEGNW